MEMCPDIVSLWPQKPERKGGKLARQKCRQKVQGFLFQFLFFNWYVFGGRGCRGGSEEILSGVLVQLHGVSHALEGSEVEGSGRYRV